MSVSGTMPETVNSSTLTKVSRGYDNMNEQFDVAIIGGGPAGATCASLIRKYNPDLRVGIFEKTKFPREHVGESQLPLIGSILNEMGCWDKVEAADFPIKLGATYRWGASPDLWDFEFIPDSSFVDEPRPAAFTGQRQWTAFQVERAIYDKILLDHANELGTEVFEQVEVEAVERNLENPDRINNLTLSDGRTIEATWFVDASGNAGILRRAMEIPVTYPGNIKNVAFWDYWDNAQWAVTIGTGGTRVFVLSIGSGWIWFIPIRKDRVSIGFICPRDFYKSSGMSASEIYDWALEQEPFVQEHIQNATREGTVHATKDWSFLSKRMTGENWFITGEAGGFADPILAGGLMLTHAGARELAYVILELNRGNHDPKWLCKHYESLQSRRIKQHIQFADFWYAGNGQFSDLEEHTRTIARKAGLRLNAKSAFQWLANGGFLDDIPGRAGIGGLDVAATKEVAKLFTGDEAASDWKINQYNTFKLNLRRADKETFPYFVDGKIIEATGYRRGLKWLPLVTHNAILVELLKKHSDVHALIDALRAHYSSHPGRSPDRIAVNIQQAMTTLEVLLVDGWVEARFDPRKKKFSIKSKGEAGMIHTNSDVAAKNMVS